MADKLAPWVLERQEWLKQQYCVKIWNDDLLSRTDIEFIAKELTRMVKED